MVKTALANPDVLDRIPLSARAVLEIGCGGGATLAAYRARNPTCTLFGIEVDPDDANLAAQHLDHVVTADPEERLAPFGAQRFDCIVYDGSLARMREPWRVLAAHAKLLNPDGMVVICVPNVEHWSFTQRLLIGSFSYRPNGLFDQHHLRWFTLESMQTTLTECGLHPFDVVGRVFDREAAQGFAAQIAPALEALGIEASIYIRRATPLQYVWRATAAAMARMQVVSTMLEPVGGVSDVRVLQPMQALGRESGLDIHIIDDREFPRVADDSPRIFIFHRPCLAGESGLAMLRGILALGYVTVCEFDDHPDYLPVLQRDDLLNFTGVHAVQTSTPALAAVLGQRNPNIAVFPNAIDSLDPPRNFTNPERLTLFFGGINREHEWRDLMPALNEVLREAGPKLFVRVVADQGFFDALQTQHKSFTPLCDYAAYRHMLAESEISLMPLRDIAFNRCKSDLKFLEAAAARCVALASPTVYANTIRHGQTGLVFTSPDMLRDSLRAVLANPLWAQGLADAARADISKHRMLAHQMAARQAWYRSLWERRDALTRALAIRVPELYVQNNNSSQ